MLNSLVQILVKAKVIRKGDSSPSGQLGAADEVFNEIACGEKKRLITIPLQVV